MIERVRTAIVGCGRIADLHALGYRDRRDARIVAVVDTNLKRAKEKASEWGAENAYKDFDAVLADPQIDLVELLVPHHLHAEMTIAACKAGKHVSVQKPMANSALECRQMISTAKDNRVILRVYENFVFYPPHVRAKKMLDAGEIGQPQMLRIHVSTGKSAGEWKVPLSAWTWRFDEKRSGGGVLVFDHGYHLFSLAYEMLGNVERVNAWIDTTPVGSYYGLVPMSVARVDAPAVIMVQFKAPHCYGVLDFANTPNLVMDTRYYSDDDRLEIIGDKGILIVNRCTAKTVDYPPLVLFRDGKTTPIEVERCEWQDSFIDCTAHLIDVLIKGGDPKLDGETGKKVLEFSLAAQISARANRDIRPDDVERIEQGILLPDLIRKDK